jgi:hypothetical protein
VLKFVSENSIQLQEEIGHGFHGFYGFSVFSVFIRVPKQYRVFA